MKLGIVKEVTRAIDEELEDLWAYYMPYINPDDCLSNPFISQRIKLPGQVDISRMNLCEKYPENRRLFQVYADLHNV